METEKGNLDYAIGWYRQILQFIGIWPDPEAELNSSSLVSRYKFLVAALVMFCFVSGPQTMNLMFIWGDLDLTVENLSTANIPISTALLKLLVFRYHQKDLRELMKTYTTDWHKVVSLEHRDSLLKSARISRRIFIGSYTLTKGMVVLYTIMKLSNNIQAGPGNRTYYFSGYFPYDALKSPFFELTFIGQFAAALYSTSTYSTIDNFIFAMVLHVCGQFDDLQRMSLELVPDCKDQKRMTEQFWRRITVLAEKHKSLIRFSEEIEKCFNKVLLIQMFVCTVQFCFQGFQLLAMTKSNMKDVPIMQLAFLVTFLIVIMAHLYVYCYVGEKLLVESSALGIAVYDCNWQNLAARDARALLLVVHRTTIPLRITAGKFCVFSLELFAKIMKTSASYLSVLITMSN